MNTQNDLISEFEKLKMETDKINANFENLGTTPIICSSDAILLVKVLDELKNLREKQESVEKTVLGELSKVQNSVFGVRNRFDKGFMELEAKIEIHEENENDKELKKQLKDHQPKNWNDLSNIIKMMVINECDFKTRHNVALTCRSGQSLVEKARPITWKTVTLNIFESGIILVAETDGFSINMTCKDDASLKNLINKLAHVFQSNVETFGVFNRYETGFSIPVWFSNELRRHAPFEFHNFTFIGNCDLINFFLNTRGVPLKKVNFVYLKRRENLNDTIDKIYGSTCLQLKTCLTKNSDLELVINHVIKKWIVTNSSIGTRFLIWNDLNSNADAIIKAARSTSFYHNSEHKSLKDYQFLVRGEKDNVEIVDGKPKTILIRNENFGLECITCVVIPTELRPSEYENARDWYWDI